MTTALTVGYFSMETAINATMPLYSGGLGVPAGDTLRSAADLHVPLLAVTLLHRKGYFYQQLDAAGLQREEPVAWVPAGHDQFPLGIVNEVLRRPELFAMKEVFSRDGVLNLTIWPGP